MTEIKYTHCINAGDMRVPVTMIGAEYWVPVNPTFKCFGINGYVPFAQGDILSLMIDKYSPKQTLIRLSVALDKMARLQVVPEVMAETAKVFAADFDLPTLKLSSKDDIGNSMAIKSGSLRDLCAIHEEVVGAMRNRAYLLNHINLMHRDIMIDEDEIRKVEAELADLVAQSTAICEEC